MQTQMNVPRSSDLNAAALRPVQQGLQHAPRAALPSQDYMPFIALVAIEGTEMP
ncbi:hypothetical protein R52603_03660 [Paraburkholderia saeva]|uniref:Uncharacterized protein n=1 Tax=Paraburkholderia saeva TaxID=2777537 RepID=A0A9N8X449_9BURK|nr:hypothetical protein R52603_03660 [Paraburkholderia saeva]CAG4913065.1 hypothetical protein R70241_04096 [Paraburkholderia saeva]CAG4926940.1 hypothetical protein LMG31841_05640 [Paraburkholderia saeva]